jgi:hypothetical protein
MAKRPLAPARDPMSGRAEHGLHRVGVIQPGPHVGTELRCSVVR